MDQHAVMQEDLDLHESNNACHKFVLAIVEDTFVRGLSYTCSFYSGVTAKDLPDHLRVHCGRRHDLDDIVIQYHMLGYWTEGSKVPEYINMIEHGYKKALRAKLHISDNLIVAILSKTMLQYGAFITKKTEC